MNFCFVLVYFCFLLFNEMGNQGFKLQTVQMFFCWEIVWHFLFWFLSSLVSISKFTVDRGTENVVCSDVRRAARRCFSRFRKPAERREVSQACCCKALLENSFIKPFPRGHGPKKLLCATELPVFRWWLLGLCLPAGLEYSADPPL